MNMLLQKCVESIVETKILSTPANWFVSYQNSDPILGLFQDSIIGAYEMTRTHVKKIHKFHAMNMCGRTTNDKVLKFDKEHYTGREIIEKFLPPINFEGRAKFYVPEFTPYIKYKDDEINVKITQGKFETGVLDKGTIGEGTNGGLYHKIYSEYGAHEALRCIYNHQQIFNRFIYFNGVTFGLKEAYMSKDARNRLNEEVAKIIKASEDVTDQLNNGQLIPPVEMTIRDYYEEMQSAALEPGDELIKVIMSEIDTNTNWLYRIAFSGSKGNKTNVSAILAVIGSIGLKGGRIPEHMDGRTTINFQRGSTNPMARGYCPSGFSSGVPAICYPFAAMEARYELIEIALSTALAGTMNRNAVKNLESIQASNMRGAIKHDRIVQLLVGETAIDPRNVETVKIPFVKQSNKDFEAQYRVPLSKIAKPWQNKNVQSTLDEEFQELKAARDLFREISLKLESHMRKNYISQDSIRSPFDPKAEIINVANAAITAGYKSSTGGLDPHAAFKRINQFIMDLPYVYMNDIQQKKKAPIPIHFENAVIFLKILIRSYLNIATLLEYGIDNLLLDQVLDKIQLKFGECFFEYGINVGVLAAESISEPITQYLLDAKHRSGLKKEKTNIIVRFDEILKNKVTSGMDNPQMVLVPLDEYKDDRHKVIEIANHIEMLSLDRFVTNTQIFIEEFGKPSHPDYQSDQTWIKKYIAHTTGDPVPKDLINWCIRYEISNDEIILKSLKIRDIITKLKEKYPLMYIIYTPQSYGPTLYVRCYMRNIMFKKGIDINEHTIKSINVELLNTIIRGIQGIINANVISIPYSSIDQQTGVMELKKMFVIETDGTNISKILENPYLKTNECNTTSIHEVEYLYGIEAARNKIIDELITTEKNAANYEWATIYADEMTYNGRVTSIQRSGLGQRELNQVLLRASFGSPVQVLQQAAINNQTDHVITSMSAPLCLGTIPKFGTTYNDIFIDYEAVKRLSENKDAKAMALLNAL